MNRLNTLKLTIEVDMDAKETKSITKHLNALGFKNPKLPALILQAVSKIVGNKHLALTGAEMRANHTNIDNGGITINRIKTNSEFELDIKGMAKVQGEVKKAKRKTPSVKKV